MVIAANVRFIVRRVHCLVRSLCAEKPLKLAKILAIELSQSRKFRVGHLGELSGVLMEAGKWDRTLGKSNRASRAVGTRAGAF